jgi:putative ABC transport system permease protein
MARGKGPAALILGAILKRDTTAFAFTLAACAIAGIVAAFQFAVFTSFLQAGSAPVRFIGADLWVTDRGVACFDMATPTSENFARQLRAEFPDARMRRVVVGFTPWVSPDGDRSNVMLVGIDDSGLSPRGFAVDRSEQRRLGLTKAGQQASIGRTTVSFAGPAEGLATFLGAPYAIIPLETAREILGYGPEQVAFIAINLGVARSDAVETRIARLQARNPEVSILTGAQFAASSSAYWQEKTGAGAAILLAAVLASGLMILLLLNGVGRFVQRRQSDFVSLVGHGASPGQLARILGGVAGMLVAGSLLMTLAICPVLDLISDPWLPWVNFTARNAAVAFALSLVCFGAALVAALVELKRFPAHVVFRS